MIQPFNRHFNGLGVPVLVYVLRDMRQVTLRSFREVVGARAFDEGSRSIGAEEITKRLATHAAIEDDWNYRSKLIDGKLLAPRFAGKTFEPLGGVCLDLDSALGVAEWSDYANWVFPLDRKGVPQTPFNRFIETTGSKVRTPRFLELKKINCALQVYVPFSSCDFSSSSFSIALHPDYGIIGNLDSGQEVTLAEVVKGSPQAYPCLSISGPREVTADGSAELTLSLKTERGTLIKDAAPTVYLEQTAGYLPRCRLIPQDGKARFKIMALGLSTGDDIRIKAGFRHCGGLVDRTLKVV
ncbi:MAG: hypothetical protein GY832_30120 [Chloroflexi bacterium]|nr:hypothetical protein [Chloroflexota bacterium]